jgi:hypothetical protein
VGFVVTVAVAAMVSLGWVRELTWTVTVPVPGDDRPLWTMITALESGGTMKAGIVCVGWLSSPIKLAVTGPFVPVMAAL